MDPIVIGRNKKDLEEFGTKGTVFLGKHYIQMHQNVSLSNEVLLDVIRSHVIFVCGKRGSGKSYTMGVIAEGMSNLPAEIKQNVSVVFLDTMGVYWTMKYPNKKDKELLREWKLKAEALDVKIFTPVGYYDEFKKKGIPTDAPFSIRPSELDISDWCMTFDVKTTEPVGVLIGKIIHGLKEKREEFSIQDIIKEIGNETEFGNDEKNAAKNLFVNTDSWGVFEKEGTPLKDLVKGGQVTVLDMSCYATVPNSWNIKNMVAGIISEKLFIERMIARKNEEFDHVYQAVNYFREDKKQEQKFPMVWLVLDEAHEFLPNEGKTLATEPLITILREGRQPGISLILASQQPGKIHTDVMTQSDTVIAHRITAKVDVDALGSLMQTYLRKGLTDELDNLPRTKGAAIIFDDTNEKMYPIQVRPRFTWHGGQAPSAYQKEEDKFEL
ncbi:ATP-binding protein [Candidatus Woesearchaeota archaeon]|nr:ATP-binding protein [Candidatus Woesearchaeota archaeon]